MSVDFPDPFGPSNPMARPRKEPCSLSRTILPPSCTSRFCSSMVALIFTFVRRRLPPSSRIVLAAEQRAQGQRVQVNHKSAVREHLDAVLLAPCGNDGGPRIGSDPLQRLQLAARQLAGERLQYR